MKLRIPWGCGGWLVNNSPGKEEDECLSKIYNTAANNDRQY